MASNPPAATPATPLMPAKSIMAPPDVRPENCSLPTHAGYAAAAPDPEVGRGDDVIGRRRQGGCRIGASTVQRTEFAVDVGTANSEPALAGAVAGLAQVRNRNACAGRFTTRYIVVKEGNNGVGMQLRLVAGPLSDRQPRRRKSVPPCWKANGPTCETTVFDGSAACAEGR